MLAERIGLPLQRDGVRSLVLGATVYSVGRGATLMLETWETAQESWFELR